MDARTGSIGDTTPLLFSTRPKKPALCIQLSSVLVACLGSVSVGLVLGYSSPALIELKTQLTDDQASWFGSLPTLGALVGGPLGGLMLDWVGRRTGIAFVSVPLVAGWLLIVYSKGYIWLYAGRLLTGVGMGMTSLSVPVYIGEVASKEYRGVLGALNQLGVVTGVLIVYALAFITHWRWMAFACAALATILLLGIIFVPDSPRWLLKHKYHGEAVSSLNKLRGDKYDIERELLEMEANLQAHAREKFKLSYMRKPSVRKPLVISIILMLLQQFCGINAIIFYAGDIFASTNFSSNPNLPPVIIGGVQVVATVISAMLMDKAGRRVLLMISGSVLTLSSGALGAYYYLQPTMDIPWLSLVSIICYIIGFSIGWGAIPWLILGELFPLKVRSAASSISVLVNWLSAFIVTKLFSELENLIHKYGAIWFFTGVSLLGVIYVALVLPETKGKSLEEIEEYFEQSNTPRPKDTSINQPIPSTSIQT